MTWQVSLHEIAGHLEKTPATTKVWLHRHGIKAARRISVGERATRALYDGATVSAHIRAEPIACPGCVSARKGTASRRVVDQ